MFGRTFLARLRIGLRDRQTLIWSVIFPLALGTLFYAAFHSIYESAGAATIPVAIVDESEYFGSAAESLGDAAYDDGTALLDITETDRAEAERLLADGDVDGIIFFTGEAETTLTVSGEGINQSILAGIVSIFRKNTALIQRAYETDPVNAEAAAAALSEEGSYLKEVSMAGDNKDPFVAYFYNLIAMICMMASMQGLMVPVSCQANLSAVGARIHASPANKVVYELAGLLAAAVIQVAITCFGVTFFLFGLRIRFGGNTVLIYLTAVLGTLLGISFGFLIGHFGSLKQRTKEAILMIIILGGGFLSGLMAANMKVFLEKHCPIVNRINPPAVLTDAFYSLNMFGAGARYMRSVYYVGIVTVVCVAAGLLLSGRKRYASI